LQITAVDRADIDPARYLSQPGLLDGVEFLARIDVARLPFDDESFDAVTSQFGIEYARPEGAVPEAARVLRRGGAVRLLLHHADSDVLAPSRIKRREMESLLAVGGVLDSLNVHIEGKLDAAGLEAAGQAHLDSDAGRSAKITGQIFDGVNRAVMLLHNGDRPQAATLSSTMMLRLGAERDRLKWLEDAAMTPERFDDVVALLESVNVSTTTAKTLCADPEGDDDYVIGWQYTGIRR
jgi:SAM-dependent methyltransferase